MLISDDMSTDGSSETISPWAARDPRIAVHRFEQNIGHTENFSFLLEQAETKYFMWLAQDDWVSPNYIRRLLQCLHANGGRHSFAIPKAVQVDRAGTVISEIDAPDFKDLTAHHRAETLLRGV